MAHGVFIHRSDSIYDDSPAERYQFPKQYRGRVERCLGDWIVYYEPTKIAGTKGYHAVARVQSVVSDPSVPGMFVALIEPGSYLDFPTPVAFMDGDAVVETGLLNEHGRLSGRAQAAVRPLSNSDFKRIIDLGLVEDASLLPRVDDVPVAAAFHEEQAPFEFEVPRDRVASLSSRLVRDRLFRSLVLKAYDRRCAVTGLQLINGGGRAEVAAAHIRPVEANGPDILSNGLALSGTAHWMFDRGLISIDDDLKILVSRHVNDEQGVRSLINPSGRALVPPRATDRPHPRFLNWHRENCFKA
ncbi:HNH endonuclease [Methylobrevis pamukkalensis]|uniref:HNH nuclease domain-containing protein n=1 Tax=Methylobrevis pamukkalensis TaxID=1439726 RepID=A0A1E3H700_9HYPH|nr:HNH endonuclease [Methylobrevis pamukkalensis]ODN72107.1 hypothetical protein A6302_00511 [Methylobrevis pamukkalensis]